MLGVTFRDPSKTESEYFKENRSILILDGEKIYYPAEGVQELILDRNAAKRGLTGVPPESRVKGVAKAEGIALGVLLILAVMAIAGVSLGMRLDATFNAHATQFFTNLTLKQGLLYFGTPGFSLIAIALVALAIAAIKDKREREHSATPPEEAGATMVELEDEPGCMTGIGLAIEAKYNEWKEAAQAREQAEKVDDKRDAHDQSPSWFAQKWADIQAWRENRDAIVIS